MAPFDIREVRELMEGDELELEKIGDRKTALFCIVSDTDMTFNFISAMVYTQKQGAGVQANHGDADFHRTEFIAENTDEQLCQDVPHHGEGHHQGAGFSGEPDAQSKAGKVLGDAIKPRLISTGRPKPRYLH